MTSNRDQSAYADQLRQLLPPGAAWNRQRDSNFGRLIEGIAAELARIDSRAGRLAEEADPRTTLELLPDWERVAALPDDCFGAPDNIGERQVALSQKLTGIGGQTAAYFIELAAQLGYFVTISEYRAARIGMRVGERINGTPWAFAWAVNVEPLDDAPDDMIFRSVARIGERVGVRLRGFGAIDLECVIRRHAPAHTQVLFRYAEVPVPDFWFDFTQGE